MGHMVVTLEMLKCLASFNATIGGRVCGQMCADGVGPV